MRNVLDESLSRRERVARVSGPGEGYRRHFLDFLRSFFIAAPLTRRFAAPSPVGRGICEKRDPEFENRLKTTFRLELR
jgi:hypothetical protein